MRPAKATDVVRAAAVAVAISLVGVFVVVSAIGVALGERHARELALLGSAVAVFAGLRCWLLRRRPERAVNEVVVLVVGSAFAWACFQCAGPSRHELRDDGELLRTCVERYHERTGRYPKSLEESGYSPRWNSFGGWQYSVDDAGSICSLRVGKYDLDGFELSWRPGDGWFEDG